jgi:hypothetical protein
MKLFFDPKVSKFLKNLPPTLGVEVDEIVELFRIHGFALSKPDLRKLSGRELWELRPKNVRLLLGKIKGGTVAVVGFYKDSNKTHIRHIELALKRLKQWQ